MSCGLRRGRAAFAADAADSGDHARPPIETPHAGGSAVSDPQAGGCRINHESARPVERGLSESVAIRVAGLSGAYDRRHRAGAAVILADAMVVRVRDEDITGARVDRERGGAVEQSRLRIPVAEAALSCAVGLGSKPSTH